MPRSRPPYALSLEQPLSIAEPTLRQALNQLLDFIRRGASGSDSLGVNKLNQLRWHLLRSSGWGMPLELFQLQHRAGADPKDVEIAWKKFQSAGLDEATRLWKSIEQEIVLWDALHLRQPSLNMKFLELIERKPVIAKALRSAERDQHRLHEALSVLENLTSELLEMLDFAIATQPGTALERLLGLHAERRDPAPLVTCRIDSHCPSFAICEDDFIEILHAIIENARTMAVAQTNFYFAGSRTGGNQVRCEVSQSRDAEWPRRTEGGLARARSLAAIYGGILDFNGGATAGETFLTIRLYRWPMN